MSETWLAYGVTVGPAHKWEGQQEPSTDTRRLVKIARCGFLLDFPAGYQWAERPTGIDLCQACLTGTFEGSFREETVLEEAQRIVNGPRRETYQHPYDDHSALGRVWAGILSKHLKVEIVDLPAHVVSMMMVGVKVIREVGVHHRDNLVDIGGYAYCADIEHEEGERRRVDE